MITFTLRKFAIACSLVCVLMTQVPSAAADNTGRLQFLYTAFLDVPALFPQTLASCTRFDPSTTAVLQDLFDQWQHEHGKYQHELQQLIRMQLTRQMGPQQAHAFIEQIRLAVQKKLVPLYFPQNHTWTDNYFCTRLLPRDLRGSSEGAGQALMLKYAQYVRELKAGAAVEDAAGHATERKTGGK